MQATYPLIHSPYYYDYEILYIFIDHAIKHPESYLERTYTHYENHLLKG